MKRFTRFPIADITSIQVGLLKIGEEDSFHFGIRLFILRKTEDGEKLILYSWNNTDLESFISKLRSKDTTGPYFHTYKPFGLSPLETGKG